LEYAKDAFDGLHLMASICAPGGEAAKAPRDAKRPARAAEAPNVATDDAASAAAATAARPAMKSCVVEDVADQNPIRRGIAVPRAPWFGVKVLDRVPLKSVAAFVNETALFRVQWQIKQKGLTPDAY